MKLINLATSFFTFAVFAATTSVTEAKFAPTSFVAKKQQRGGAKDPAVLDALTEDHHDILDGAKSAGPAKSLASSQSFLSRLRAGGLMDALITPEITYYFDLAWTALVAVFMYFWFQSFQAFEANKDTYLDQLPNFNKQVLKDGFCIAQDKTTTLFGLGTLKLCGIVDAILIVSSYFIYKDRFSVEANWNIYLASAAYTVVHGAIHFFEVDQSGQMWDPNNSLATNVITVVLLAVITLFTPIGIDGIFKQAGRTDGLLVGVTAWIAFILYYIFGIKEKVYALTYINVTIFLSIFGARALVFPKDDEKRLEFYRGKSILATILAATANIVVMCFEPLACKDWFAGVGGHIWFDLTLWLLLMSVIN